MYYLNNHMHIILDYHERVFAHSDKKAAERVYRLVGFRVAPFSVSLFQLKWAQISMAIWGYFIVYYIAGYIVCLCIVPEVSCVPPYSA